MKYGTKLGRDDRWVRVSPLWSTMDRGAGGDCLFHALAYVVAESENMREPPTVCQMRHLLARCVTPANVDQLLQHYVAEVEAGEYQAEWPRLAARLPTPEARCSLFQRVIVTEGWLYQGDQHALALYTLAYNVHFVIVHLSGTAPPKYIVQQLPKTAKTILFLAYMPGHWQVAGLHANSHAAPQCWVPRKELPRAVLADYYRTTGHALLGDW